MTRTDDFMRRAEETAGFVADKTVEIAKCAAEKTLLLAKMAKIRGDLALERDALKKQRIELGKAYYRKYGQNPDEELAAACARIETALENIAAQKAELALLKEQLKENPFASDDYE